MGKDKFVYEFEINASKKMLYPYLSTASGLAQWYADDATIDEDKMFHFKWEDKDHKAHKVSHRTNAYVRFEFQENGEASGEENPDYVEFRIETNEMTQTTFIKVIDYTEFDDKEEQGEVWHNLLTTLKETVGG